MLSEKVVVVTGGAGLLGAHFCSAIASRKGIAVIADIDKNSADVLSKKINDDGGEAISIHLDITSGDSIDNLISVIDSRYGRIDAVVNNAYPRNISYGRKLEDVTYGDFCENLNSHLGGYFLVSQKFSLYFKTHGGGNILNMASIYGTLTPRFEIYDDTDMTMPIEYAANKSAIIQISRYFAQYYKRYGIRCNSLSPGGILANQPDKFIKKYSSFCGSKGMLETGDISGTLLFLLSDASKHINGQNIILDDGFSI